MWPWSAFMEGCACIPTGRASFLHLCGKCSQIYWHIQLNHLEPVQAGKNPRWDKGKSDIFVCRERTYMPERDSYRPGLYRNETPDLPGMPDFGFPKWVPTAEVDPSSPGAQTTLWGWLFSQDICILEICWRFLIMSFLWLVVWINLVVRRSVNSLAHIIYSMYSDAVFWILSTALPSVKKRDFKCWGLSFSFLAVSGGYM